MQDFDNAGKVMLEDDGEPGGDVDQRTAATARRTPSEGLRFGGHPDPDSFDITTFVADLSTTLANIAAILIVIDNNN